MDFGKESSKSEWRSFSECVLINCFLNRREMFSSVSHREFFERIFSLNRIEKIRIKLIKTCNNKQGSNAISG